MIALRLFSMPGRAARLLFNHYPLHASARVAAGEVLHILIAGFGALGQAIALQFMHLAHYGGPRGRITVLDSNPSMRREGFISAYPQARNSCDIDFQELRQPSLDATPAVTGAYVCPEAQSDAVRICRELRKLLSGCGLSPPIFLHLDDYQPSTDPGDWDGQTFPFSTRDDLRTVAQMLSNQGDEQAETIHNYYRDSIVSQGQELGATPAGRPWEDLEESYRDASRHQADHMEAKLAAIGCRSTPQEQSEFFAFTHLEAEKLAL
ncbi:MAG: Ryanodine receptor Ryr, partial [Gammaproteobacteria bacterium]|nr:Ryanodine receptor Ryr [Gammaproteobacteria bacterium]